MTHDCKGIHNRFAAPMGKRNYRDSYRCSLCELFITFNKPSTPYCPCCGYVMRKNRRQERNSPSKLKLRQKQFK